MEQSRKSIPTWMRENIPRPCYPRFRDVLTGGRRIVFRLPFYLRISGTGYNWPLLRPVHPRSLLSRQGCLSYLSSLFSQGHACVHPCKTLNLLAFFLWLHFGVVGRDYSATLRCRLRLCVYSSIRPFALYSSRISGNSKSSPVSSIHCASRSWHRSFSF